MGFLSRLFGGGSDKESQPKDDYKDIEPIIYKEFEIYPCAIKEGGQFRVAGKIELTKDGELCTHRFIRSDVLMSSQDANDLMLSKAKLYIDQMGTKIFD